MLGNSSPLYRITFRPWTVITILPDLKILPEKIGNGTKENFIKRGCFTLGWELKSDIYKCMIALHCTAKRTPISQKIKACHSSVFDNIEYANIHTYITCIYAERKALATLASGCWVSESINKYKYKKTNTEIQIQRPLAILASDDAVQGGSGRAGQPRRPLPPPTIIQRRPSSPVYGSIPYYIWEHPTHVRVFHIYMYEHFVHMIML